jgi:tRNA dimethylallyltransferase
MPPGNPLLLVFAGPTGVGKSEVAVGLAERIGGEIVSVDSMQIYRGMDIGTAKPSKEDQARVRHHLLDVVEVRESFDAFQFARLAKAAVADIQARGAVPILCGGTGLYFKAFFEGISETPGVNADLRPELENTPLEVLLRELEERDPVAFQRIDRKNRRRVVRAVEVIRLTGKPFSEQRADWGAGTKGAEADSGALLVGLNRRAEELEQRIARRVEEMFRRGLVEETRVLLENGLGENRTAMQALGYRQVVEFLRGQREHKETVELVKLRTRQYAKRQMTWFRRQLPLRWIELEGGDSAGIVEGLAEEMSHRSFTL